MTLTRHAPSDSPRFEVSGVMEPDARHVWARGQSPKAGPMPRVSGSSACAM